MISNITLRKISPNTHVPSDGLDFLFPGVPVSSEQNCILYIVLKVHEAIFSELGALCQQFPSTAD